MAPTAASMRAVNSSAGALNLQDVGKSRGTMCSSLALIKPASVIEMKKDHIRERTTAALIVARRRQGRRAKGGLTFRSIEAARKLLASGMSAREIAPAIGEPYPL